MYPLNFTYEERWYDQRPQAYKEAIDLCSGIEWCLPVAALSNAHYRERMVQAATLGLRFVFHLPHHLAGEGLSVATSESALSESSFGMRPQVLASYTRYYEAILLALKTIGPISAPVLVVHHPLKADLSVTAELLAHLHQKFNSSGLQPVLEPTPDSPDRDALCQLAQRWAQETEHRLLCLDIRYMQQLGWTTESDFEALFPHCAYGHFHSLETPHCAPETLTRPMAEWLAEAASQGVPIGLELLLAAYHKTPEALTNTLNLIQPVLIY